MDLNNVNLVGTLRINNVKRNEEQQITEISATISVEGPNGRTDIIPCQFWASNIQMLSNGLINAIMATSYKNKFMISGRLEHRTYTVTRNDIRRASKYSSRCNLTYVNVTSYQLIYMDSNGTDDVVNGNIREDLHPAAEIRDDNLPF